MPCGATDSLTGCAPSRHGGPLAVTVLVTVVIAAACGQPAEDGAAPEPTTTSPPGALAPTPATPGPDASPTSTGSVTATPSEPVPLSFERVPFWAEQFALGRETTMSDLAAAGGEVLVVGMRASGAVAWKPVVRPWGVIANPSFEGEDVRLAAIAPPFVTEDQPTRPYVAVGGSFDRGMAWATLTGSRGRLRPVEGAGLLRDVAAAGRMVVAAGEDDAGEPAAFRSTDGVDWQAGRVPDGGLEPASPRGSVPLRAVAHGPAGFVATGWPTSATGRPLAETHLWISEDGRRWRHLDPAGTGIDGGVVALAGRAEGYVAVTDDGVVYRSGDARSWQRASRLPRPGQRPLGLSSVQALGATGRLVVSGSVCESQRRLDCSPTLWAASGGETWRRQRLPGEGQPRSVARIDDGQLVVVGWRSCPDDCAGDVLRVAVAWVTAPIAPAP